MKKLISLSLFYLVACAPPSDRVIMTETAVISGKDVPRESRLNKSTVGLILPKANQSCTGVLISDNLVLTAAHCVLDHRNGSVYSESAHYDEARFRNVADAKVHENYRPDDSGSDFDIALVKFDGDPLPNVIAAVLAGSPKLYLRNLPIQIAGFGITDTTTGESALTLKSAEQRLTHPDYSDKEFVMMPFNGASNCHGDSGGPAYATIRNQLVTLGIVSRSLTKSGITNCSEGVVYTKIVKFKSWIIENAKELEPNARLQFL